MMKPLRQRLLMLGLALLLVLSGTLGWIEPAIAFCGFYVAKADTKLYNQASQVAIARDGERTVLTMANDYQGEPKDFALVVPVPTVLEKDQVNVAQPSIIERLDAFSAPRLVEYFDPDPCIPPVPSPLMSRASMADAAAPGGNRVRNESLGVTIEAQFNVGEYEIVILSAKESNGLETWLKQSGYKIPSGASPLLQPYIRQGMKFFVAKVNLKEFEQAGFQRLRPLQIAYESKRFMLPIRLGMTNAPGNTQANQDLLVYLLSPRGRAELTNYRTVNIPSDVEIPTFVKSEFEEFYKAMYRTAHRKENGRVAFLEYAWSMRGCDPCAADPLSPEELRQAGVFWVQPQDFRNDVFITRLHVRYNRDKFPEDLMFQETDNQQLFQGRYILRHAFKGEAKCKAGEDYRRSLPQRYEREAQTLAKLTDWSLNDIRRKLPQSTAPVRRWWQNLWERPSPNKSFDKDLSAWWRGLW